MSKRKVVVFGNEADVVYKLKREQGAVLGRYNKLITFMASDAFKKLPGVEQELMYHQKFCMLNYSYCLQKRMNEIENRRNAFEASKAKKPCKCAKKAVKPNA